MSFGDEREEEMEEREEQRKENGKKEGRSRKEEKKREEDNEKREEKYERGKIEKGRKGERKGIRDTSPTRLAKPKKNHLPYPTGPCWRAVESQSRGRD